MPDTSRTRAALLPLFADNATGAITAQHMRDFVASARTLLDDPPADPATAAAAAVAAHVGFPDPHPQYLTAAEGDAAYAKLAGPVTHTGTHLFASGATTATALRVQGVTGQTAAVVEVLRPDGSAGLSVAGGGADLTLSGVVTAITGFALSNGRFVEDGGTVCVRSPSAHFQLTSTSQVKWSNGGDSYTGMTFTAGLGVVADGVLRVTDGGAGRGALDGLRLAPLADAAAPADLFYFSTTAGKLVYKTSGGVVHPLY